MVGRGSFIESFPLFGYDLEDYDEHVLFGNARFIAQMSIGPIEHKKVMRSIELYRDGDKHPRFV